MMNSRPLNQSQIKESHEPSKLKPEEKIENNEVSDFDHMAFLEERRRRTTKTAQRDFMDEEIQSNS